MKMRAWLRTTNERMRAWLGSTNDAVVMPSKFIDLAPTDQADQAGVYSDALLFATSNPRVSNIALTGPYGSGKSSIIRSFLKKYKGKPLQISLAAFLPEAAAPGGVVSKQEIERSILQQMLYGADANRLPLSRFKRIQSPGRRAIFTSLYMALGLLACWYLIRSVDEIISGEYFVPFSASNWLNIVTLLVGFTFIWVALHRFYVASFGISLKSISLKDIEITPVAATEESILNRHLDEIIYFFQSTKYDLVIVEDLDRFDNAEIFVTLREINSLINANYGVKRDIRFLYALRDDMFVNVDRTKFFEFIIPVIPIINSSNSIDKVLEQGKRLSLDDRLNGQFLREVSRYLNDLRLIRNIFNEYAIYVASLEIGEEKVLDPNKLLAVLIYKNVFPPDFEDLHRGKGNLAEILGRRDEFVASGEAAYKAEIARLEERMDLAKRQLPTDLHELRRIYAMALIEKAPAWASLFNLDGQAAKPMSALTDEKTFEQILDAKHINFRDHQGQSRRVDLSSLQSEVNAVKTYNDRRNEVQHKSAESVSEATKTIRELRDKLSAMRISRFHEVLQLNADKLEHQFTKYGENAALARFLILEGYIDDTYYQYTSLFHSGRLSPSDNKFLIQIRGFVTPDPDFQIDNPKEVIAAMRDDDFRQSYVLNVKLADCILGDSSNYSSQAAKLFEFIASDFERCAPFFAAYYLAGREVSALVAGLAKTWPGFVPAAVASSKNLSHVAHIVARLPPKTLQALSLKHPEVAEFVSRNLPEMLALGVDIDPENLKYINVEVEDLAAVGEFPGVARLLFEAGLYRLSPENIEFIFTSMLGRDELQNLRSRNYTTVLNVDDRALLSRIDRNFGSYLKDVLLRLDANSQEDISAILSVIAHDELDLDDLGAFLEEQSAHIPSLDQVPTRLHGMVFRTGKIEASWGNCLAYLNSEGFDAETLTAYLNTEATEIALSRHTVPDGEKAHVLREFLIENDELRADAYRTYVRNLPGPFPEFPEDLSDEKMRILIEEEKVSFSEENFEFLGDAADLQVMFLSKNIDAYLAEETPFEIDDDFREKLLASSIRDNHKLEVIRSMDLGLLANLPARAAAVGRILYRTRAELSFLDKDSARAVIVNSSPVAVQISLLNRVQGYMEEQDIRETLAMLPEPFSDIRAGYHIPRIQNTPENRELVRWLDERDIISSWSDSFFLDEIRINLYRR